MQTPIMFTGGSASPSTSAVNYCAVIGCNQNVVWTSVSTAMRTPFPIAGTISKLYIRFPTLGTGTYRITLRKNGSNTTLTAQADLTGTGLASDLANSFTVAAGDLIDIMCDPEGSTPTSQTAQLQVSMLFTADVSGESFILAGSRASAAAYSTGTYYALGWCDIGDATLANRYSVMPNDGVIDKLYVNFPTAPGAGDTFVVELYKNGSATGLTCTVSDTNTTASDLTHTVTVAQNDLLTYLVTGTGTPASSYFRAGVRFVPTVNGESAQFNGWTTAPAANANRYNPGSGASSGNIATVSQTYNYVPVAFTAKKLTMSLGTGPEGGTRTRSVWIQTGTGSTADSAVTAVCTDTQTTANDNTNTVAVAAADFLNVRTTSSASATSPGNMRVSFVAYIAPAAAGVNTLPLLGVG